MEERKGQSWEEEEENKEREEGERGKRKHERGKKAATSGGSRTYRPKSIHGEAVTFLSLSEINFSG